MNRFSNLIGMLFCTVIILLSSGLAEDSANTVVVADGSSNAYLYSADGKTYLLGFASYETLVADEQNPHIDYVVSYCEHEQHKAQKQALADTLGAAVLTVAELPETMQQDGAVIAGDVAFAAEKKAVNYKTLDCVGNYLRYSASTNESAVNVREIPTTKGKRVDRLKRGEVLTVVGQVANEKGEIWYLVELTNGKTGYIRSDLLKVADEIPETKADVVQETKKEKRYIANKKSKVFHRPSCNHLPSSKNIVYISSRSYAISTGYKPCSHCNP